MNNDNGRSADKYLKMKIFLAKIMGIAVLIVSMEFSQNGFGFKNQDIAYVGWVLAIAVTVAQFVFNSKVRNLNWTITALGIMAYIYSIWTNIVGFYEYQGKTVSMDTLLNVNAILPIFASAFMDIFPETILSWAFNSSTDGDLIGNTLAVMNDPDSIFSKGRNTQANNQPNTNNNHNQNRNNNQSGSNYQNRNVNVPTSNPILSNIPRVGYKDEKQMGYNTDKIFEDKGLDEEIERMRRLRENRV